MLEFYLRSSYQKYFVDKPAKIFGKFFSPNFITFLALIFGILNPIFLSTGFSYFAIFCLLASGYCDTLDGTIARLQKSGSETGSVFDIIVDRIVEFAAVLGLFLLDPVHRGLACMCMLGSMLICVTSFLVVGIFEKNTGNKGFFYSAGLMERAEAFAFFIAMMLLPKYFNVLAIMFTILVLWTAIIRVYNFSRKRTNFFVRSENNVGA
jgi:archaetidylinositol phosphate synthase